MVVFHDLNGHQVELSFEKGTFSLEPTHILVLAKYEDKWLLTKHPKRGIEFPGGKVEIGESIEEAAIRETLEETNVMITNLEWFAEYVVHEEPCFCKAVYIANVGYIKGESTTFETDGAVWLTTDEFLTCDHLSFHMKDAGMRVILEKVNAYEGKWKD